MGEADALTIRFNAMNEAWGYRTQAVNSRNNARMARFGGKQASRNTYLTTAASLAGQAYGGYQSGAFTGGGGSARSEERRVGEECVTTVSIRGARDRQKKKNSQRHRTHSIERNNT